MTGNKEKLNPRVLFFINRLVIGGPAIDVISMAGFLQNDFEILIIYGEKESHEVEASFLLSQYPNLKLQKITGLKRTINPFLTLIVFFSVSKIIKSFKPSIVHTHGALPGVIGRIAAYFSRTPIIIHTFHGHFFHSYFNRFFSSIIILIEKALSHFSNGIIATSNHQLTDLVDTYKIAPKNKVSVIELGIDNAFLNTSSNTAKEDFIEKYHIDSDTVCIGIIARIVRVKNFSLFVKVVDAVLQQTTKSVKFFVVGDGYMKTEIQQELSSHNIKWSSANDSKPDTSVIFTSWISHIGDILAALDIVILTSHNEGTGLSLAESQYCGKPVVATNVGGVPDTLIDGHTGFLVEPANAKEFTEKLLLLIEDKELRQKMGAEAGIFAKNKFSKQAETENLKALYFKVMKENGLDF